MSKEYLGDSVYVDLSDYGDLILTTENGLPTDPSNTIYMEPAVIRALLLYLRNYSPKILEDR